MWELWWKRGTGTRVSQSHSVFPYQCNSTAAPYYSCITGGGGMVDRAGFIIVSGYGLAERVIEVRSPAEAKGFFL
jgi:hypothetical protein